MPALDSFPRAAGSRPGRLQRRSLRGPEALEPRQLLTAVEPLPAVWIAADELAGFPTSGPAWDHLLAASSKVAPAPNLSHQDEDTDVLTLAKALVGVRLGDEALLAAARANVLAAIGTEAGGRTLALGRNLTGYVAAAGLTGLAAEDAERLRTWLTGLAGTVLDGQTLAEAHEARPNNWGVMTGAARAARAAFLGDQAELDRVADVFRGWLGDRAAYAGFEFGADLSWQADPLLPVAVNPAGAIRDGVSIDGALPDEMRRGDSFRWPAAETNYPWGALQGAVVLAELLARAGYDAWEWQDRALLRAVRFVYGLGRPPEPDDAWIAWLVDARYGTALAQETAGRPGKIMGWTSWTHAGPLPIEGNRPPLVSAGPDQFAIEPAPLVPLAGSAVDATAPEGLSVAWTQMAGPAAAAFDDPAAAATAVRLDLPGRYVLRLTASDGTLTVSDDVTVVVDPQTPPVSVLEAEVFQFREDAQGHTWQNIPREGPGAGVLAGAAGGYVQALTDAGLDSGRFHAGPAAPYLEYELSISPGGVYGLDLLVAGVSLASDSVWVQLPTGTLLDSEGALPAPAAALGIGARTGQFTWRNAGQWNLPAGRHTIRLSMRESGTAVDELRLERLGPSPTFVQGLTMIEAAPPTAAETAADHRWFTLPAAEIAAVQPTGAGGPYLQALHTSGQDSGTLHAAPAPPWLDYRLFVLAPGSYSLELLSAGVSRASDSLWVQFLGAVLSDAKGNPLGPEQSLLVGLSTPGFSWKSAGLWNLAAGLQTIRVSMRESGGALEALRLTLVSPPGGAALPEPSPERALAAAAEQPAPAVDPPQPKRSRPRPSLRWNRSPPR